MTRNLFTVAAIALLASTTLLASFGDAEARGGGRAGGFHRMGNPSRHAGIARGANIHRGQLARANHLGRAVARPQGNRGLHAGQMARHGANPGQLNRRTQSVGLNAQMGNRNNLNGPNKQANAPSSNLTQGPKALQSRTPARSYGDMGMSNPGQQQPNNNAGQQQANNTPNNNGKRPSPAQQIIKQWTNTFVNNLNPKNIYDVGQSGKFPIGTTFSLCLNAAACAAGAPPAVVEVLTAPLPAVTTSALEAGVNAFTPIDPKDPLSTPVDIGAKNATLDIPNAVKQQLGGSLPPAWGDLK